MSDLSDVNDDRPSAADSLRNEVSAMRRQVEEAVAAAESFASDLGRRGADDYRSGNAAVSAHVDPLPGLMLAATAGFLAGCFWASGSQR